MSLLTTVQEAATGNYYFQLDSGTTSSLPSGISVGNSGFSAGPSGTFFKTITVPGASTSSIFLVTPSTPVANITDAIDAPVVSAFGTGLGGGGLIVYVKTLPSSANFSISWACIKL